MNRKITVLSSIVICVAVFVTVLGFGADSRKTDTTNVAIDVKYADGSTVTTNAIGALIENVAGGNVVGDALGSAGQNISSALEGVTGNLSGAGSNIEDALGSIGNGNGLAGVVGGIGDTIDTLSGVINGLTSTTAKSTTELDTITPVPAVSQYDTQVANPIVTQNTTEPTTDSDNVGETVDFSATSNPYKKPTIELKAGDKDASVKWVQWIFIYTHYGLNEDGITGELDENTVHLIKKFQAEKGLPVSGDMTKDFVDSLELYFYECTFGTSSTTAVELAQPTQMETVENVNEGEEKSNLAILIVALVFIWVLAIVAIVVLVIFLKKRKTVANNAQTTAPLVAAEVKTASDDSQDEQGKTEEKKQKTLEELFDE